MPLDEYPHEVVFLKKTKVSDGGGGYVTGWKEELSFNGFLDTPSSRDLFTANQLTKPFDCSLYYPYRKDVTTDMRCQCEGDTYEIVGRPEDQGGQHEIMKVSLKLVNNG